jgi:hypothetical protein
LTLVAARPDAFHPVQAALNCLTGTLQELIASIGSGRGPAKEAIHAADAVYGSAHLLDGVHVEGEFPFVRQGLTLVGGLVPPVGAPLAFVSASVSEVRRSFAVKQLTLPLVDLVLRHSMMVRPCLCGT